MKDKYKKLFYTTYATKNYQSDKLSKLYQSNNIFLHFKPSTMCIEINKRLPKGANF